MNILILWSEPVLLLTVIFIAAGLVKGVTGMGLPTVAMGLLGSLMSPVAAAALLLMPSAVTNVWQMLAGNYTVELWRRLWPMMLGIVLGTLPGVTLLASIDTAWSGMALGSILIIYAAGALFSPVLVVPVRYEFWLSPLTGFITGMITGVTGVFAIPAVPYLQALRLEKEQLIQALGLSFTISTLALAAGLTLNGAFRAEQLGMSVLCVLPALAGMWLGQLIRKRISQQVFRRCLLLFLLIIGLQLVLRPFF
ncbi:sulfite exporter TauE/SafE family protein [Chromatiaceae bacterium AAb-1]|nr:sulfite exporter TauE/SafE family protein [Chromatiaceae bacterium AAb-1]